MTKSYIIRSLICASLTIAAGLPVACTDDGAGSGQRRLSLTMGTQRFADVDAATTRALPEGFSDYSTFYSPLPTHGRIQAYLAAAGAEAPTVVLFDYADDGDRRRWTNRVHLENDGIYHIYGCLPREDVGGVSIEPYLGDYANGAVLQLSDIDAVTSADICVIAGIDDRIGRFDKTINTEDVTASLLLDHIFCSLHFQMKVSASYNELRTIKVKKLQLAAIEGSTAVKAVTVRVTLEANSEALDPVTTVDIISASTGRAEQPALLYDNADDPVVLTTAAQSFRGFYAPATNEDFVLEATYDVYDKKGNLLRENQTARNRLQPASTLTAGQEYNYVITVAPTYLYMLSDDDLNSPAFTIG